jgi:glutathione S-transferase
VKLFRDHGAWCPYCQKVWLQLEEKKIPYTLEKINMRCYGDKPPEYTAKVPSLLLPGK